jgi:hypothetical protein
LFHGPFDDELGVLGPSLSEINGFVSSREEDTVDFGENGGNLVLSAESVDGNNLSTGHLNKLDIRGGNVRLKVINIVLITGLGEDTNDWGLLGISLSKCEYQE